VSLSLVCHELPRDAAARVFDEAMRVLRPGGALAIMEMNPNSAFVDKLSKVRARRLSRRLLHAGHCTSCACDGVLGWCICCKLGLPPRVHPPHRGRSRKKSRHASSPGCTLPSRQHLHHLLQQLRPLSPSSGRRRTPSSVATSSRVSAMLFTHPVTSVRKRQSVSFSLSLSLNPSLARHDTEPLRFHGAQGHGAVSGRLYDLSHRGRAQGASHRPTATKKLRIVMWRGATENGP
jgi:hypothetical protein